MFLKPLYYLAHQSIDAKRIYKKLEYIIFHIFVDTDCLRSYIALKMLQKLQDLVHYLHSFLFYIFSESPNNFIVTVTVCNWNLYPSFILNIKLLLILWKRRVGLVCGVLCFFIKYLIKFWIFELLIYYCLWTIRLIQTHYSMLELYFKLLLLYFLLIFFYV